MAPDGDPAAGQVLAEQGLQVLGGRQATARQVQHGQVRGGPLGQQPQAVAVHVAGQARQGRQPVEAVALVHLPAARIRQGRLQPRARLAVVPDVRRQGHRLQVPLLDDHLLGFGHPAGDVQLVVPGRAAGHHGGHEGQVHGLLHQHPPGAGGRQGPVQRDPLTADVVERDGHPGQVAGRRPGQGHGGHVGLAHVEAAPGHGLLGDLPAAEVAGRAVGPEHHGLHRAHRGVQRLGRGRPRGGQHQHSRQHSRRHSQPHVPPLDAPPGPR